MNSIEVIYDLFSKFINDIIIFNFNQSVDKSNSKEMLLALHQVHQIEIYAYKSTIVI
jgi:hypothetical protein